MENKQNRIPIWDGWRGMAITLLLLGHFSGTDWIWEDRLGVDAFFVLSGMLMSTILFEKRMPLKDFYIRRFSRIFPAFALFVIVSYGFAFIAWQYFGRNEFNFEKGEFFSTLTFFRTYYPLDPHMWDTTVTIGHLWSLNVEEHAYVIMSIMTLFLLRNSKVAYVLTALGFISIGMCFYYYGIEEAAPEHFRIRTESAISFVFLSAAYNLFKKQFRITVPSYLPVLTLFLAFLCYLENPSGKGHALYIPQLSFSLAPILLAFTLNHITEAHRFLRRILAFKPLRYMGIWSFSIYLWQQPIYNFKWVFPGGSLVAVPVAIMVGILSFYLFESPVRKWINNRWTKHVSLDIKPTVGSAVQ
ncbi:MAG: acyltransferase [Cocleimonas sp.]